MAIRSLIRERFFPHLWCPGCGHGHVLNAMLHSVDDLGYDPSSLVMVSGIGCSARIAGYVEPFTPSTAVQIRLGTPKISIGYSSSVFGLQELGYNFSSGDLLLRNFCFKQVFHYLPDAAASQSRKNFALVRVQPRAFRIAVRRSRPIMSHENLGSIQA